MTLMAEKIMQIDEKELEFYKKGVWTPYPRAPGENVSIINIIQNWTHFLCS